MTSKWEKLLKQWALNYTSSKPTHVNIEDILLKQELPMKAFGLIALMLGLGIAAWLTVKQQKPEGPSGQNTAKIAVSKANRIQAKAQLGGVSSAVNLFKVQEGRLPNSLQELADKEFLDRVPNGLDYDPETGEVSVAE